MLSTTCRLKAMLQLLSMDYVHRHLPWMKIRLSSPVIGRRKKPRPCTKSTSSRFVSENTKMGNFDAHSSETETVHCTKKWPESWETPWPWTSTWSEQTVSVHSASPIRYLINTLQLQGFWRQITHKRKIFENPFQ